MVQIGTAFQDTVNIARCGPENHLSKIVAKLYSFDCWPKKCETPVSNWEEMDLFTASRHSKCRNIDSLVNSVASSQSAGRAGSPGLIWKMPV